MLGRGGIHMADVYSREQRSKVMATVRSTGNKVTELRMIVVFKAAGITGWRRRQPVFGRPDFVFPKEKVALFVDGCFWHGCPKHYTIPVQNGEFWRNKKLRNMKRDRLVTRTLMAQGWKVVRVCEHALRKGGGPAVGARVLRVLALRRNPTPPGPPLPRGGEKPDAAETSHSSRPANSSPPLGKGGRGGASPSPASG